MLTSALHRSCTLRRHAPAACEAAATASAGGAADSACMRCMGVPKRHVPMPPHLASLHGAVLLSLAQVCDRQQAHGGVGAGGGRRNKALHLAPAQLLTRTGRGWSSGTPLCAYQRVGHRRWGAELPASAT